MIEHVPHVEASSMRYGKKSQTRPTVDHTLKEQQQQNGKHMEWSVLLLLDTYIWQQWARVEDMSCIVCAPWRALLHVAFFCSRDFILGIARQCLGLTKRDGGAGFIHSFLISQARSPSPLTPSLVHHVFTLRISDGTHSRDIYTT